MRSRVIFKGKLLRLSTEERVLPNGHRAHLEVIKHPGAALVIPFVTAKKIILLRQLRPVINAYIYELPAGTLERRERPIVCARRELVEETGYAARTFRKLGVIYPVPGYSTEKITIYKATDLHKKEVCAEKDEIIKHAVVEKQEVRQLFRSGKIVDAKTICALTLCRWL
ncbi:MAG: NUDIX hydrolase [Candidatus Omnitrophica bacterium]|nr:NUDIX hydrolase [Candidatus Omnitrophota bacterium]